MESRPEITQLTADKKFLSKSELKDALADVLDISKEAVITDFGYDGERFMVEVMEEDESRMRSLWH
jgi:hypothetical protein